MEVRVFFRTVVVGIVLGSGLLVTSGNIAKGEEVDDLKDTKAIVAFRCNLLRLSALAALALSEVQHAEPIEKVPMGAHKLGEGRRTVSTRLLQDPLSYTKFG